MTWSTKNRCLPLYTAEGDQRLHTTKFPHHDPKSRCITNSKQDRTSAGSKRLQDVSFVISPSISRLYLSYFPAARIVSETKGDVQPNRYHMEMRTLLAGRITLQERRSG